VLVSAYFPRPLNLEGVGTLVFGLARGLTEAGWRVRILVPAGTRVPESCRGLAGVLSYRGGVTGWLSYVRALRREARDSETVLWVENNPNLAWLGSLARGAARGCWYFYSPLQDLALIPALGWRLQAVAHALTKNATWSRLQGWGRRRCMVATGYQARQLQRLRAGSVTVNPAVPLPADFARASRAEARRHLGWDERPVAGYLGHFSPAKGVGLLLRAYSGLAAADPAPVLALAYSGGGRLGAADAALLERLRGTGRVRDVGVTDPAVFLAACDTVVLPYPSASIHHPPLVLFESYAAATAVVTTDVGGVAEMVRPGESGALIAPGDEAALARAMGGLLADLPACHGQGRRAQAWFRERLSQGPFTAALAQFLLQKDGR
jgi:glycosyltransferase involved in cell wall biosynthesis